MAQPATCRHFFGVVASLFLSIGAGWFFWGHEASACQRVANVLYRLFLLHGYMCCPGAMSWVFMVQKLALQ